MVEPGDDPPTGTDTTAGAASSVPPRKVNPIWPLRCAHSERSEPATPTCSGVDPCASTAPAGVIADQSTTLRTAVTANTTHLVMALPPAGAPVRTLSQHTAQEAGWTYCNPSSTSTPAGTMRSG